MRRLPRFAVRHLLPLLFAAALAAQTGCAPKSPPATELWKASFDHVQARAPWLLTSKTLGVPSFVDVGDHWRASLPAWLYDDAELIVEIPKGTTQVSRAYVTIPLEGEANIRHIRELVRIMSKESLEHPVPIPSATAPSPERGVKTP